MLLLNLNLLATAPAGVARLRELILTLAVQGKLVPQDASDEPASVLLQKIRAEKDRLIAEGKIKRDKPLAEIAEEEKPFGIPQGWEWVRFGDASINRDGERDPVSAADRDNRAKIYDYYGASGVIDKIDGYLFDKTLLLIGEDGANLFNRSSPIAFLAHGKYWVNNHAHVIDATHRELLDYLALFINAISLEPYVTGTAQPKMNQAKLNSILIALPPLAEQSRIVTRVEELMRLCDALEAKARLEATQHEQLVRTLLSTLTTSTTPEELANNWHRIAPHFDLLLDRPEAVDALEQTILQLAVRGHLVPQDPQDEPASELLKKIRAEKNKLIAEGKIKRDKPLPPIADEEKPFELPQGWEWVRLDAIFRVITDGDHLPPPVSDTGIAFLTIGNISAGALNFDGCRSVPQHYFDAIAEYRRPAMGDILYTVVGASYGREVVVETDRPFCVQRHIGILKPSVQVNLQYVATLLSSQFIYEQATRSLTGTAQPTIGIRPLRNFLAPLPPLAEQSRIVARVASLRALCADLRQRLTTARTQQALLAEVLVQDVAQS